MQKVIMEFDPNEDKEEIQAVLHAKELLRIIQDFKEWLSKEKKYTERDSITIEEIRTKLNELISANSCEFIFDYQGEEVEKVKEKIKFKPKFFYSRIEISEKQLKKKHKSLAEELLPIYKKNMKDEYRFLKESINKMLQGKIS